MDGLPWGLTFRGEEVEKSVDTCSIMANEILLSIDYGLGAAAEQQEDSIAQQPNGFAFPTTGLSSLYHQNTSLHSVACAKSSFPDLDALRQRGP